MEDPQRKPVVSEEAGKITQSAGGGKVVSDPRDPAAARKAVAHEAASWKGISVHQHRFGGVEFRVGRRELGHPHASFADLPFPRRVRDKLIAEGRARPHHVLPDSGWVTVPMRTETEIAGVVELFRLNYKRAMGVQR